MTDAHTAVAASAVAATERALAAIKCLNPTLNAMLAVTADSALAAAREADAATARGDWLGLLHGVPMTIKDCMNVTGVRTTYGSPLLFDHVADSDSEVVRRLRTTGAALLGKTNLTEFCYGAVGQNFHTGDCRNPWDPACATGGSSSGAAASVAAGMCRIAMGSDTGGSIRIPAALCGVAGLRPTFGRVSNRNALELTSLFDTSGPLAYGVADVARAFAAIAGYDADDPASVDVPVGNFLPTLRDGVSGLRVGIPRRFFFDSLQPEVETCVLAAARVLEACGARLIDVSVPDAEMSHQQTMFTMAVADMADFHHDRVAHHADKIGPEVLRRLRLGHEVSGEQYAHALRWLVRWKGALRRLFMDVDILLTPTTPMTAPRLADAADMVQATRTLGRLAAGLGAAGLPTLSVPCGFDGRGMPIGMHLAAAWFNEPAVLRAGVAYQARTDFHHARPRMAQC